VILRFIPHPFRDIGNAIVMPLKALFVVGLCGVINWMTYSGTWWVKWVAFGMGIAVLVAFARAARTLLLLALVSWVGWTIYKRHGGEARQRFDEWATRTRPAAAQLLAVLREPARSL
jgi:hypothetical protein